MKKFQFSLDTVLDYKQQVLTSLQSEHGAILLRVRQQEEVLEQTEHAHRELNEEFTRRRAEGISIKDALMLESGLRVLERDIDREAQKLLALQKQEEKKRDEVIEAKKRPRPWRCSGTRSWSSTARRRQNRTSCLSRRS